MTAAIGIRRAMCRIRFVLGMAALGIPAFAAAQPEGLRPPTDDCDTMAWNGYFSAWEASAPADAQLWIDRFNYDFNRSRRAEIVPARCRGYVSCGGRVVRAAHPDRFDGCRDRNHRPAGRLRRAAFRTGDRGHRSRNRASSRPARHVSGACRGLRLRRTLRADDRCALCARRAGGGERWSLACAGWPTVEYVEPKQLIAGYLQDYVNRLFEAASSSDGDAAGESLGRLARCEVGIVRRVSWALNNLRSVALRRRPHRRSARLLRPRLGGRSVGRYDALQYRVSLSADGATRKAPARGGGGCSTRPTWTIGGGPRSCSAKWTGRPPHNKIFALDITIYTDGSALGNPGPGGYGAVLLSGPFRKEMSAGFRLTTNNRMELMAVCAALEALKFAGSDVVVYPIRNTSSTPSRRAGSSVGRRRGVRRKEESRSVAAISRRIPPSPRAFRLGEGACRDSGEQPLRPDGRGGGQRARSAGRYGATRRRGRRGERRRNPRTVARRSLVGRRFF